jgi:nucleotide-binding universal stress UspA family protein
MTSTSQTTPMPANASAMALPARLLLATDLSARCDRALDRAAQLAGEWRAELVALNVLDEATSPDQALAWVSGKDGGYALSIARQQLARDLSGLDIQATLRIARSSDAAASIRDAAASSGCGLVVTGVSCSELFGRCPLGSTVERLARTLAQPLLVVRQRVHGPYQRIVVATDFSDAARHALLAAVRLFPGREVILYHACEMALAGLSNNLEPARVSRMRQVIEKGDYANFMAATELPAQAQVRPVIEHGVLESTLTQYVRSHGIDLVMMGARGRSAVMTVLLGSSAAKLLDWLPCDALVVREPLCNS